MKSIKALLFLGLALISVVSCVHSAPPPLDDHSIVLVSSDVKTPVATINLIDCSVITQEYADAVLEAFVRKMEGNDIEVGAIAIIDDEATWMDLAETVGTKFRSCERCVFVGYRSYWLTDSDLATYDAGNDFCRPPSDLNVIRGQDAEDLLKRL